MLEWICLILLIISIILVIVGVACDWDWVFGTGIATFIIIIIVSGILLPVCYIETYDMPNYYIGKCEAIEEIDELLLKYENTTDIAIGLEAVELKATLAQIISEKNEKLAGMRSWLANPIMPFKDNIRNSLGTYIADI